MRERRRSIDYRHQAESFRTRDASESPKFAAATNNQKMGKFDIIIILIVIIQNF